MDNLIALAGNPNSGKSTLFNALTGARQHVGNYPGVTVEKKQGTMQINSIPVTVVDLPGTYSLTAYSFEEVVARDFLINEKPAMIINILDASNLERNLYLTLQFIELGIPVCLALNMMDMAESRGIQINTAKLSRLLGMPVVPIVARTNRGKDALTAAAADLLVNAPRHSALNISYGNDIDNALEKMTALITAHAFLTDMYPARWTALKFLESDDQIQTAGLAADREIGLRLLEIVNATAQHIRVTLDSYPEAIIADQRYGYIQSVLKQDVIKYGGDRNRLQLSDKIDKVVVHRFFGPIIMLLVLFGLYQLTFTYSAAPVRWFEALFGHLAGIVDAVLADGLLKSLLIAGVIGGVGGVLSFIPLIMFMFLGIAILEDSGYLARVAFMLDRIMRVFGLHGSSVMAFIISGGIAGGCAVPGVLATRTLKSPRERLATLLTVPFMNCGAKLPVFALLVAAFFARHQGVVMFGITLASWTGALLVAKLLRATVIKGEATPFVMELPPYRVPTFKGLAIHTWERTWQYIKKAGTVILGISILLWAMMTFPGLSNNDRQFFESQRREILAGLPESVAHQVVTATEVEGLSAAARDAVRQLGAVDAQESEARLRLSIAGRLGSALEGLSQWAGFDWRTNIALVGGFAAKEVIVATLATAYSLGDLDTEQSVPLAQTLAASDHWRPLTALSLIIFVMFYAPCFVTVVCIAKETGSWKWGAFSMVFNTVLAFSLAVAVFQVGTLIGL